MVTGKLLNYEILKRSFEGKNDPIKNDDAITSKYYPSKKYITIFNIEWSHGGISEFKRTFTTKTEALEDIETLKQYGMKVN